MEEMRERVQNKVNNEKSAGHDGKMEKNMTMCQCLFQDDNPEVPFVVITSLIEPTFLLVY